MNITDLKLYCLNASAFTISLTDWIEPALECFLLMLTIGYTLHRWYLLKKEKKENNQL